LARARQLRVVIRVEAALLCLFLPPEPVMTDATAWSRCNICKKPISWGGVWYRCSVSTCNKKRLPLHFCSPDCWDAHLPDANHRGPLCIEERAPFRP